MHKIDGRQFGLWHVGMWLAAAGFATPTIAGTPAHQASTMASAVPLVVLQRDNLDDATALPSAADATVADGTADTAMTLDAGDTLDAGQTLGATDIADSLDAPAIVDAIDAADAADAADADAIHAMDTVSLAALHNMATRAIAPGDWSRVDDGTLEGARGGFTSADGLLVSLGIDRLVSINGDVLAHTRIDIADLSRISAEQARQTSEALSAVKLVQSGGENIYRAGDPGAALGGMVVQNSLDNQLIRTDTVIRSTVNSAGLLNTLNFHATVHDALTRVVGQP
ncbi:hypothetical protein [Massilia sp. PWRC2]|uniref:hypothetical protein n=1 Tax=Massilia sp. PWRC2 TaxID=2804626 RepID=UPI003CFA0392